MLNLDKEYYEKGYKLIAGCDEAGRGCLCGPVIAAAVIFPCGYTNFKINDSKQLTEKQREELYKIILSDALYIGIYEVEPSEIDEINIYMASKKAMIESLNQIDYEFDCVLTDAMAFKYKNADVFPIIKGDAKSLSIAAASILAKVTRDRLLEEYSYIYPKYLFNKHKGYCTKKHLEIIKKEGIIKGFYRESYQPVRDILFPPLKLF